MNDSSYAIEVTNEPDGDGDYCATVLNGTAHVKTIYRKDRFEVIEAARKWAKADAEFDRANVERITLDI